MIDTQFVIYLITLNLFCIFTRLARGLQNKNYQKFIV